MSLKSETPDRVQLKEENCKTTSRENYHVIKNRN